jgi:threonine/homoserine/homoserine lactone efflux protein
MLSGAIGALRSRVDLRALRWINRVSGLVLLAFGIAALALAMIVARSAGSLAR